MQSHSDTTRTGIGGKARQLVELQLAGFRVPDFLCSPRDLTKAVELLGYPLAVRSSASAEDGRDVSFAGQFRSFLNLRTLEEVETAVSACQASVRADSVKEYCRRNGLDHAALQMSVIVQRMVQPELAGVAFTVNPATGAETVVIEACEGLADELLAGTKASLPATHPLVAKYRPEIERVARKIQRHFGAPQDIEFAIENGELFVLQARPITRIQFAPGTGEWTNADFRDGGVSSEVCTPLMWSLYDFIWDGSLKGFLRELHLLDGDFQAGKMFFGRPYWNLGAVKQCVAKLPGYVEREFDRDLSVEPTYEGEGVCTPTTLGGLIRALPTVLAAPRIWKQQAEFDRAFLNGGFAARLVAIEARAGEPDAFRKLILEDYWTTESNYFRTIFCVSLAKLTFLESFPEADYPALVAALPPLRHLDPTRVIREMAGSGARDVAALQKRFPHRSRRELDLRAPRWDEDPEWVAGLLDQHVSAEAPDPRPAYERARAEALAKLPWYRRRSFEKKLDRLRHFLWLREEMRDLSSRMYHVIRRHVLAIAEQHRLGDDVFFLKVHELIDLVDAQRAKRPEGHDQTLASRDCFGPKESGRARVARRRATYDSFRNFKAPNEIGARFAFEPRTAQGAMRGIGASRGRVQGVARVARTIEDAMRVERGAILICPFTDPGWTPVLDRVAAVVTETGGLLSHAAVICREYGIPAVLGVADATTRVPDGARIVVDGGGGFVELSQPGVKPDRRG